MSVEWEIRGTPPHDLEVIGPSGVDLLKLLPVVGLTLEVDATGSKFVVVCRAKHIRARMRSKVAVRVDEGGKPSRHVRRIELDNGEILEV